MFPVPGFIIVDYSSPTNSAIRSRMVMEALEQFIQ